MGKEASSEEGVGGVWNVCKELTRGAAHPAVSLLHIMSSIFGGISAETPKFTVLKKLADRAEVR